MPTKSKKSKQKVQKKNPSANSNIAKKDDLKWVENSVVYKYRSLLPGFSFSVLQEMLVKVNNSQNLLNYYPGLKSQGLRFSQDVALEVANRNSESKIAIGQVHVNGSIHDHYWNVINGNRHIDLFGSLHFDENTRKNISYIFLDVIEDLDEYDLNAESPKLSLLNQYLYLGNTKSQTSNPESPKLLKVPGTPKNNAFDDW